MINNKNVDENRLNQYQLNDETVLLSYEEASKEFESLVPKNWSLEEIILILLAVAPDKPIKGKTMMIKQLFLLEKEILKGSYDLKFIGHKFGPHSFLVENMLKNMEFIGLIKRSSSRYKITKKGLDRITPQMKKIDNNFLDNLKKKRITWDELGGEGILNLVYDRYPTFTDNSLIKERYQIINWKKENEN